VVLAHRGHSILLRLRGSIGSRGRQWGEVLAHPVVIDWSGTARRGGVPPRTRRKNLVERRLRNLDVTCEALETPLSFLLLVEVLELSLVVSWWVR
jgi:hypothetical protein